MAIRRSFLAAISLVFLAAACSPGGVAADDPSTTQTGGPVQPTPPLNPGGELSSPPGAAGTAPAQGEETTEGDAPPPPAGQPVPEPGTMFLVGTGLASVALYRRRRRDALS
ncbi:MAG: PEP-CTERM sorting domain-containing protein [Planctomycetota bacterium]